jgi:20S proteasome subunit alpha 4
MPHHAEAITVIAFLTLLLALMPSQSRAAHSRRRIVVTRERDVYDRVITDFSPDGRLSQVEYGMEAARRGSMIMAAVVSKAGVCVVIHNSSFGKMHRIDHHIWLVTAGLSGDSRFLASHLRKTCQQHRLNYGEAPTTEQVAKMAGNFQHYLTRAGGIRPLGCSAVVVGIDPIPGNDDVVHDRLLGIPRAFQTDPGGVVEACKGCCAIGKAAGEAMSRDFASLLVDDDDQHDNDASRLAQTASRMAQRVIEKVDEDPKTVDVWIIEPLNGKRGGMQTTCYRGLNKDSLSNDNGRGFRQDVS